ncbi:MAG: ExeA family protein [Succinivibrio sp.]
MYETYFSLTEAPFDGLPDERFYYVGSAQKQALGLLKEQLSRQGSMCVLQGPSGSGKTTLVRMLIRTLPQRMRIIAIDDPRLNPHLLLATVLRACGVAATSLEAVAELTFRLRQMLDNPMRDDELTTVIIDEAQGLSDETLEQVRLMSNIEGTTGRRINFLLVGQEQLTRRIQRPSMKMFWSRVRAFATVPALKRDEVQAYISFRLQQAGCHEPLFTQNALLEVFKGSGGLPRLINSIADEALSIACHYNRRQVSRRMVRRAVSLVRHGHAGLAARAGRILRKASRALCYRVPSLLLGAALSCAVFAAAWHFFPRSPSVEAVSAALNGKAAVKAAADGYFRARSYALSRQGRETGIFFSYRAQSLFKSDSVSSLIGLWGYRRKDGSPAQCQDLDKTPLACFDRAGDLDEALEMDRPAVLQMRDENLTPYYAVAVKADKDSVRLLLSDRIFDVRRDFVKAEYDGAYLQILPRHRAFMERFPSFQQARQKGILPELECALKVGEGSVRTQALYSQALVAFKFRFGTARERLAALDRCSQEGPRLYSDDGRPEDGRDDEDPDEAQAQDAQGGAPASDAGAAQGDAAGKGAGADAGAKAEDGGSALKPPAPNGGEGGEDGR